MPNPPDGRYETWSGASPPFLTTEAMAFLAAGHWRHILVDLPSVDRDSDGGQLNNHRQWWGLASGVKTTAGTTSERTITEMIYVPDELSDDLYALSLQVAPFILDAAPSRPILFPLHAE
jgi:arylformamidase